MPVSLFPLLPENSDTVDCRAENIPESEGDRRDMVGDLRQVYLAHRPYLAQEERSGGTTNEKSGLFRAS